MSGSADRRVRRPSDKSGVLEELVGADAPFQALRDVLVFAAALGFSRGVRVSFESSDEPIRWDTMCNRRGTEGLVDMLSAASADGDPQILDDSQFESRIRAFEEYANGGLEILESECSRSVTSLSDMVVRLIRGESAESSGEIPDLSQMLGGLASN